MKFGRDRRLWNHQQKEACSLLGRVLLSFTVDDESPLWTRDEVRGFIAAAQHSNPAFPAYFFMAPGFGMFLLWFGSLADPAAFQGTALNLAHISVINHVIESIAAIHEMADRLGFQAGPVIQALLTPYPRDDADRIARLLSAHTTRIRPYHEEQADS